MQALPTLARLVLMTIVFCSTPVFSQVIEVGALGGPIRLGATYDELGRINPGLGLPPIDQKEKGAFAQPVDIHRVDRSTNKKLEFRFMFERNVKATAWTLDFVRADATNADTASAQFAFWFNELRRTYGMPVSFNDGGTGLGGSSPQLEYYFCSSDRNVEITLKKGEANASLMYRGAQNRWSEQCKRFAASPQRNVPLPGNASSAQNQANTPAPQPAPQPALRPTPQLATPLATAFVTPSGISLKTEGRENYRLNLLCWNVATSLLALELAPPQLKKVADGMFAAVLSNAQADGLSRETVLRDVSEVQLLGERYMRREKDSSGRALLATDSGHCTRSGLLR